MIYPKIDLAPTMIILSIFIWINVSMSSVTLNHDKVYDIMNRFNGDLMHRDTEHGTEMVTLGFFVQVLNILMRL